jgi:hypothetical protein
MEAEGEEEAPAWFMISTCCFFGSKATEGREKERKKKWEHTTNNKDKDTDTDGLSPSVCLCESVCP